MALHLAPSILCLSLSALAVFGAWLEPPCRFSMPVPTRYTGIWSFLTFQTNVISAGYFGICVVSALVPDTLLDPCVVTGFPLAFALDLLLTPLYYGLDHFNAENVKVRRKWTQGVEIDGTRMVYPYVEVAAHLQHAPGAVVALVAALCIQASPSRVACTVGPCSYLAFYLTQTIACRVATGAWVYPVLEDVQRAAGLVGVGAFILVVCAVGAVLAWVGKALVDARLAL